MNNIDPPPVTVPRSGGRQPVSFGSALNLFRAAGMAPSSDKPADELDTIDPAATDEVAAAVPAASPTGVSVRAATPGLPLAAEHWPDGPARVLERIDALSLSDVVWDEQVVLAAVREVAELADLPYSRIRVVRDPAEFPTDPDSLPDLYYRESSDTPLRLGWVRQLGVLADRRHVTRLRDWVSSERRPDDSAHAGPGHVLQAHATAEHWVVSEGIVGELVLGSVTERVEAYLGFMLNNGAAGWDQAWQPRDGILEEFGEELRIGRVLADAFCSGLGYLVAVDNEIVVSPRPALRVLDDAGADGRPRFHHDSGPAIEFADGSGPRFLEGVHFQSWVHRAIVDGALTMRYVRDMDWQSARIAAYPSMPPAALLDGLDAHLLDVGTKGTLLYRIDDMPDHDGPAWYMVTIDPSTGREYGEFVPPEVGKRGSADAAQAAASWR